jgi:CTP:molybdopterin cytidylyltransferase MocA
MSALCVLAAGEGRRLGGPKALLAWPVLPQRWLLPLAAAHAEARSDVDRIVVVTRPEIAAVLRRVAPTTWSARVALVEATPPDPAGSIAAALARIDRADPVLITPVDVPPASAAVVCALQAALGAGVDAARPLHAGRRGHPVAVRRTVLDRYADPDPPPLREVLAALGARVADVPVDDAQVLCDLDTAEDLAAWSRRFGGGAIEPTFFE